MYYIASFNFLLIFVPTPTLCSYLGVGLLHHIKYAGLSFLSGEGYLYASAYAEFSFTFLVLFLCIAKGAAAL